MNAIVKLYRSLKEIPEKYPAVISGYIIYLYLFFVMIRFFVVAKSSKVNFYDVFEMFDALPFMWLLAMTLVKVIHIRTKLHESETQRILKDQELQLKETQIVTMKEVVLGLQHQVNNPLAIILLTIHTVKRCETLSPEMTGYIDSIEEESKRITQVLKEFSEMKKYEVEHIDKLLGAMAIPVKQD
jgi:hypothetical protein